jgi:hypothetical protein
MKRLRNLAAKKVVGLCGANFPSSLFIFLHPLLFLPAKAESLRLRTKISQFLDKKIPVSGQKKTYAIYKLPSKNRIFL